MIYPQRKCVTWLTMLVGLVMIFEVSVFITEWPYETDTLIPFFMIGFLMTIALDGFLTFFYKIPIFRREFNNSAVISKPLTITYTVFNKQSHKLSCQISDHLPSIFHRSVRIIETVLNPEHVTSIEQTVHPTHRGHYQWSRADINVSSPLGLWWRRFSIKETAVINIYPDIAAIQSLFIFAHSSLNNKSGAKRNRKRGSGQIFHQLRDYHQGDSLRQVDWNASSRHRRLISKDYQEEQDQHIVLMLDCGRRMKTRDGMVSHFDLALNAVLMLAFGAFKQGDRVSMFTFAGAQRELRNLKGTRSINTLINEMYDLQPSNNASDYFYSLSALSKNFNKRSLIVITTTCRAESLEDLLQAIAHLQKRHHVLVANLIESIVDQTVIRDIENDDDDADRFLGALMYKEELDKSFSFLKRSGCGILQATPQTLGTQLLQYYHGLKRAGML